MRKYAKWIHLLLLTALLVTVMPFSSHALMTHPATHEVTLSDGISSDCAGHHASEEPQQPSTYPHDCDCVASACFNPAMPSTSYSINPASTLICLVHDRDSHARTAFMHRPERPPRA
jgi:hypothetical protein